jgi:phosphatidylglycerophosphate synthase
MPVLASPEAPMSVFVPEPTGREGGFRISRTGIWVAAFTVARLSLVPVIILSFLKLPALTTAAIVLFVILDVLDGVVAREHRADGPRRRALDSAIDRIGIDAGMVGACVAGLLPLPLLAALLLRDAYCGVVCARMVYRRRVAIKADWVYRGLNLCVAVGAIAAPFTPEGLWVALAGFLSLMSLAVAVDLTRCVRIVESAPETVRDTVIPAGAVRRGFLG